MFYKIINIEAIESARIYLKTQVLHHCRADLLAANGAKVVLTDILAEQGQATAASIGA